MFQTEPIPNIMPYGHGPNAIELPDGRLLVTWIAGSYEGGEDQRSGATVGSTGAWEQPFTAIDAFPFDGDTWYPETAVPLPGDEAGRALLFWAYPRQSMRLVDNPRTLRVDGGWGGGAWFPLHTLTYTEQVHTRLIARSRVFRVPLGDDLRATTPEPFDDERGLVLLGAARQLRSGRVLVPYHVERSERMFRSHVFAGDDGAWRRGGDIYAEPGCLEPVIAELEPDYVVCLMRYGGFNGHVWYAHSRDGGESFTEPRLSNLRNPHAAIDVAVSSASGRLLITYNDSYTQRTPLCVGISDDRGQTFRVRDVETRPGHFGYPKLLNTSDGLWHLFYSNDVRFIQHAVFDESWLEDGRRVIGGISLP